MPTHSIPPGPGQRQDGATAPFREDADGASGAPGRASPLLDVDALREMEGDFSDADVVKRFARDFSTSLEEKMDRLDLRLQAYDATGAYDAVLSLTTSSAMVGAERLAQAARVLQRMIAADDLAGARRSTALLRACGAETLRELQEQYLDT